MRILVEELFRRERNSMDEIKIVNDRGAFWEMMEDMRDVPEVFCPTNLWKSLEPKTISWLRNNDINQFRNIDAELGAHFSVDPLSLPFSNRLIDAKENRLIVKIESILDRIGLALKIGVLSYPRTIKMLSGGLKLYAKTLQALSYYCVKLVDKGGVLDRIEDSGLGNPLDIFTVNGRRYTFGFLTKISQYVYMKKFIDFENINNVLEIGPGFGTLAEVFAKAHPHLKICIVDIPPQLYFAQQYLSACFKNEVASYNLVKRQKRIDSKFFKDFRIICLAPWQLPNIESLQFELFCNTISFQEMEPHVVENYAKYIDELVTTWIYLMQRPAGTTQTNIIGKVGVLKKTCIEHYIKFFHRFELLEHCLAEIIPRVEFSEKYEHMIFKRK